MRAKNDKVIDVGITGFHRSKWNPSVTWCHCHWRPKLWVLSEVSNASRLDLFRIPDRRLKKNCYDWLKKFWPTKGEIDLCIHNFHRFGKFLSIITSKKFLSFLNSLLSGTLVTHIFHHLKLFHSSMMLFFPVLYPFVFHFGYFLLLFIKFTNFFLQF